MVQHIIQDQALLASIRGIGQSLILAEKFPVNKDGISYDPKTGRVVDAQTGKLIEGDAATIKMLADLPSTQLGFGDTNHFDPAIDQWLIDNMPNFAENGVQNLFLEDEVSGQLSQEINRILKDSPNPEAELEVLRQNYLASEAPSKRTGTSENMTRSFVIMEQIDQGILKDIDEVNYSGIKEKLRITDQTPPEVMEYYSDVLTQYHSAKHEGVGILPFVQNLDAIYEQSNLAQAHPFTKQTYESLKFEAENAGYAQGITDVPEGSAYDYLEKGDQEGFYQKLGVDAENQVHKDVALSIFETYEGMKEKGYALQTCVAQTEGLIIYMAPPELSIRASNAKLAMQDAIKQDFNENVAPVLTQNIQQEQTEIANLNFEKVYQATQLGMEGHGVDNYPGHSGSMIEVVERNKVIADAAKNIINDGKVLNKPTEQKPEESIYEFGRTHYGRVTGIDDLMDQGNHQPDDFSTIDIIKDTQTFSTQAGSLTYNVANLANALEYHKTGIEGLDPEWEGIYLEAKNFKPPDYVIVLDENNQAQLHDGKTLYSNSN